MTASTVTKSVISESGGSVAASETPGRILVTLMTPGWGSSGFYSEAVVKQAAEDKVFPAGLHMYVDHPTLTEKEERPERSVKDLAAVLLENARWDPHQRRLVAEARPYSAWRGQLAEMATDIGTSIRAYADGVLGEAEGRKGRIVTQLLEGLSCDFVTHAGRGGRFVVLESAGDEVQEARNVGQWVEASIHRDFTCIADAMYGDGRLTREERITLSSAIGDALSSFVAKLETDAPQLYTRDLWAEAPTQTAVAEAVAALTASPSLTGDQIREALARHVAAEATADERTRQLRDALNAAYETDDEPMWVWVRDFDIDSNVVWFQIDRGDDAGTWQQTFTVAADDESVELTGERIKVRAETNYVPVDEAAPADPAIESTPGDPGGPSANPPVPVDPAGPNPIQESEEDTMPQIEEARLRQLEEAHGRVPALEAERDSAVRERDDARREAAEARAETRARDLARARVAEARPELSVQVVDRVVAEATRRIPLTDENRLDVEKLNGSVDEALKAEETYLSRLLDEAAGPGSGVRGLGGSGDGPTVTAESVQDKHDRIFGNRTAVKGA